jgi:hypothetical protein
VVVVAPVQFGMHTKAVTVWGQSFISKEWAALSLLPTLLPLKIPYCPLLVSISCGGANVTVLGIFPLLPSTVLVDNVVLSFEASVEDVMWY